MKQCWIFLKNVVLSFLDNNCSTHAAGLTYFALLAVIPVLCCILVAAKACRVDALAREQLNAKIDAVIVEIESGQDDSLAAYLPGTSEEERQRKRIAAREFATTARKIADELFERVEKFDVGTLGWIGFGFLLWTVISSLASVEASFNQIWGVREARPVWKRAYMYLFIMIVIPVLATIAMSVPVLGVAKDVIVATLGATWLTKWAGDGILWILDSVFFRVATTVSFSTLLFGLLYYALPHCRVGKFAAVLGGLTTAVCFYGWIKLCAIAQVGIARSSALYGSFAFLPIVLAWLYMSWQIVLVGACFTREAEKIPFSSPWRKKK